MSVAAVRRVVSRLESDSPPTDAELVSAIAPAGVTRETAFAELVSRHGSMVLGVCRGVLADSHAAEDAFQAVFLVLARKANTIRPPGAVGGWLYGVAVRTARKAKTAAARRQRREMAAIMSANPVQEIGAELDRAELRAIIDAELAALPETHRAAIVLCDLQGKTRAEAASELNHTEGTVASWLSRGRKTLASRLARRGIALPAAGLVAVVTPAIVSAELSSAALGAFAGRGVSGSVLALAEGVMRSLSSASTKVVAMCAVGVLLAAVATATAWHANPDAPPQPPTGAVPVAAPPPAPKPEPITKPVTELSFSPDGTKYVVIGDGKATIFDAITGKRLYFFDAETARFSADSKSIFVLTDAILECNTTTGKVVKSTDRPKTKVPWRDAVIAPDGKRIAADTGSHVGVYDVATGKEVCQLTVRLNDRISEFAVRLAGFSPDGTHLAATGVALEKDGTGGGAVWEVATGKRVAAFADGAMDQVRGVAFAPTGDEVAVGYADRVEVWVIRGDVKKNPVKKIGTAGIVTALAYSKDGKRLAVGVRNPILHGGEKVPRVIGHKTEVQVFDATAAKELERFDGFEGVNHVATTKLPVAALAFSPDGKKLLAGTGYRFADPRVGEVKLFDLTAPPAKPAPVAEQKWTEAAVLTDHKGLVNAVAVAPDGKSFAAATDGGVICWDLATRKKLWNFKPTDSATFALTYSRDGKHLLVATTIDVTRLDAATGKNDPWTDDNAIWFGKATALAYHPTEDRLAASDGYVTKVRRLVGKDEESTFGSRPKGDAPERRMGLAWAPEGKFLAIPQQSHDPDKPDVWCIGLSTNGVAVPKRMLNGPKAEITGVAWSRDGKLVVAGDEKGNLFAWDAATGKELWRKELKRSDGTPSRVHTLALSPADNTVAVAVSCGSDLKASEQIHLLAAKDGETVGRVGVWKTAVVAIAWFPDGRTLVASGGAKSGDDGGLCSDVYLWSRNDF